MGKLLKYEIKKDYKYYFGMYIIILLLNVAVWIFGSKSSEGRPVILVASLTSFAAYITTFISVIKSYRNELYEDTGYLMFTLPRSGNEILGSKLITGTSWIIITSIITAVLSIIGAIIVKGAPDMSFYHLNMSNEMIRRLIINGIFLIISILFFTAYLILMIYFSITISKVTLHNKKGGSIFGFLVFILLSVLFIVVNVWCIKTFPQAISLAGHVMINNGNGFSANADGAVINIATSIFNILSFIGLFLSAGWLLQNKVDM